jgi:Skp family chaperone for outer membrane proteins
VSASAAFYSVSGLSKLFAGASLEVIIMASSLEIAKLVIASLLYQYWDSINKALRTYLTIAAGVLILITSMGIYGFLSAAYQETANKAGNIDAQVSLIEVKRDNIKEQLAVYNAEKESINAAVSNLRSGLAGNIQTYKDKDGNILSTSSSANRKSLERQLDQAISRQSDLNSKVDELNTKLFEYETEIVEVKTNSELAGELGPLKYLSGLTGVSMDKIINVLLLIIIFVFDPLAIALVIAANFAFAQLRSKEGYHMYNAGFLHEEEIDNPEYKEWEEATLNDGLEDLPWEEEEETKDEDLEPQIEVKMSGEPSLSMLNEEEKQYDLDGDGILNDQEKAKFAEEKLLNNPGISSWRKKKIQDYLNGKTKSYW